jgi:homoserine kinase
VSIQGEQGIVVRVPATSANLGAGFDVLGLALGLHNVFYAAPADHISIEVEGFTGSLPLDSTNLFYTSFTHLYALAGHEAPPLHVRMRLAVPPGRGLGSSATAVIGGLVAANSLLGNPYDDQRLLLEALKLEHGGHADNVAPALLGGLVVNVVADGELISLRVPFPEELKAVLFSPEFMMDTVHGRTLMPEKYSKEDVVFNTSRVGLFVAAVTQKRYDLLRVAMEDRMHQPYRAQLFPLLPRLIESALESGAHGACLSGGGSSVLALATEDLEVIEQSMARTAALAGMSGRTHILEIDHEGAQVIHGAEKP